MKNLPFLIIFSFPLIIILVDKKNFKQKEAQCPISLPPNNAMLLGRKREGIKIIEIEIIHKKKKIENKKFLII